jgi:hypothetical protein
MPAYSFKQQFEQAVKTSLKEHTLRNKRKRKTVPGDKLALYVSMRTKFCRLIKRVICTFVYDVRLTTKSITIGGKKVKDLNAFAISDGFKDFKEMIKFWKDTHSLPWNGELISWSNKDPQNIFCSSDSVKDYSEFPKKFSELIGTHNQYNKGGKVVCKGIIIDIRWSCRYIMKLNGTKKGKEYYGIELKFKPDDGSRAIWTTPFSSEILINKN